MNQLLTIFPAFLDNWIGGLALMIAMSYLIMKACDIFELATDYLGRNMSRSQGSYFKCSRLFNARIFNYCIFPFNVC